MTRHELKEEIKTILANRLGSEPGGFPENSEGGRALVMLQELQKLEACEARRDVEGTQFAAIKLKALLREEGLHHGGRTTRRNEDRDSWIVAEFEKRRSDKPRLTAKTHMTNIGKCRELKERNAASPLSYKSVHDIIRRHKKLSG